MDGAGLRGSIERAQRVLEGLDRVTDLATGGGLDGFRDERLGGATAWLIDLRPALGGAHALERRGSSSAGPAAGLPGQVQTSWMHETGWRACSGHDPTREGEWYQKPRSTATLLRRCRALAPDDRSNDHDADGALHATKRMFRRPRPRIRATELPSRCDFIPWRSEERR